jgi:Glycine-rich domain-containing protein-like
LLTARTIKGAVSGLHDPTTPEEEVAGVDLQIILKTTLLPESGTSAAAARIHLVAYAASTTEARWTDIMSSFQKTTAQLKGARLLRMLSRGNVFPSIRVAYQGILWSDLSIDLVAAALRQREFLSKITSADCAGIDTPAALFKAATRYHKFLLLMRRKTQGKSAQKKTSLVPTLDIDLLWHTHQLNAVSYRQWCIQHLGIAVNHDDSVGKEVLDDGLKDTTKAWYEAYREQYAVNEVGGAEKVGKISKIFSRKKSVETSTIFISFWGLMCGFFACFEWDAGIYVDVCVLVELSTGLAVPSFLHKLKGCGWVGCKC